MHPEKYRQLTAGKNDEGKRLDRVLRDLLPELGLVDLQKALRRGDIRVDGQKAAGDQRLAAGQTLAVFHGLWTRGQNQAPQTPASPPVLSAAELENLTLFRNAEVWALNKPAGIPSNGPRSLDESVKAALAGQIDSGLSFSPGSLHQLDQGTSGLLWFSVNLEGARVFSGWLQAGLLAKDYLALLQGELKEPQVWDDNLARDKTQKITRQAQNGKPALTRVQPLLRADGKTLALCRIETGRTHQIRAQAAFHGFPLAGDGKYGGRPWPGGFRLHAWRMSLPLNSWGLEQVSAPLPDAFAQDLRQIFGLKDQSFLASL